MVVEGGCECLVTSASATNGPFSPLEAFIWWPSNRSVTVLVWESRKEALDTAALNAANASATMQTGRVLKRRRVPVTRNEHM
ncbi:hypothetical protein LMH87_000931 [Akanthomyces muscarius]|uniref:Uncharacterized protein n=1 Tax=Akanthomyces muscarius TaxID=2231603 RepID=A0A9W8QFI3_AKAMU|nr:hypothetical protein LMH87_000931 [Akanthomyces muscarius]KAJ4155697.1 hypothetical protein LMH87_000931 [Akanthomyces muscarius]